VRIRLANARDAGGVLAVYAPVVEDTAISFELVVPSVDEMAARIAERWPAHPWLVAEDQRGVVGYAYAGPLSGRAAYDWSVEVSVYIAAAARGRHVGRGLYTALLAVLAAQGYRQAMAGATLPNAASAGLHESMGFTPVGVYRAVGWKHGAWHDVGWWQRPLIDGGEPPAGPIRLDELPADTLDAAIAAGEAALG
jgi:L-amino acid N-acyltransferase YncA